MTFIFRKNEVILYPEKDVVYYINYFIYGNHLFGNCIFPFYFSHF